MASRRIKLTYLITDLKVGGVPLHLWRLAARLPRERFDIRVIALADEGPVGQMLRQAGIDVYACGARSVRQLGALGRLWKELLAHPPDLLHALLFHANFASRLIGPLAGIAPRRILNEIQTVEIERPWHLFLDGLTCRLCRLEIANSPSVLEHLHRKARVPRGRLRCEWGGVDAQAIAAAAPLDRRAWGVQPDELMLLWTGRLDPVKGFEEMLAAVALLRERHRFKLLLAGDGPYRSTVEQLIAEHGLGERVKLLGRRDDIPRLLKTADIFLFCSRTEGLPNSVLEAMAAGLPIVCTRVPGCQDLVCDRVTGILVNPQDSADIARGVEVLITHPALRLELGRAARAWVSRHTDLEVWVRRWVSLYENLLQEEIRG